MSGLISRAWRLRGFGVHSPFAYSYLRDVIRPRTDARYYAEESMKTPRERLLYRIMVEAIGHRPTLIATGPAQTAQLEEYALTRRRGVIFIHPGRMAIFCRRDIPFLRLEINLPRR
ncbi:MAG: hypothetical protein NC342_08200 [Pseudoflavonifractor sp.]|nr:hypothetical protein [Alloprevotella sp.]MCM1117502.1 hypothetical protein [Pseudoflavonifractor sp.]